MKGTMTALEVLTTTRRLLSDEARWTQGASFRDAQNNSCYLAEAVRYCLLGGLTATMHLEECKGTTEIEV